MDTNLLASFVAVADASSFTRAAVSLGVTQSTVSQQIRRLEAALSVALFERDTHTVQLTGEGRMLLDAARGILASLGEIEMRLRTPQMLGEVRIGFAEDFASSRLLDILRQFRRAHAHVKISIDIGLSRTLIQKLDCGELDLALIKCHAEDCPGERRLLSEPLVWVGLEKRSDLARARPLPLALHPEPSITRRIVTHHLAAAGIPFEIVHVAANLNALRTGVAAELGVSAFGMNFVPAGLQILDLEDCGLPRLPPLNFVLVRRKGLNEASRLLGSLIESNVVALQYPAGK